MLSLCGSYVSCAHASDVSLQASFVVSGTAAAHNNTNLHPPLTATARPKREAEPRAVLKIEVAEVSDMVVYKRIITIIRYMYSALEDVDATRALVARSKGEDIDTIFVCHKQASSSCD